MALHRRKSREEASMSTFTNEKVREVSQFLQEYMRRRSRATMTSDECADVLSWGNILSNQVGAKPGFNFRQMLRDGRDGHIHMVAGASQERRHSKWMIRFMPQAPILLG
jgi:hypothetical protein